mmetsp:Transcript_31543/g.27937  ORF Transcript_31543/g.27937 Transcript_31543/m.27937 type:complete len:152 (+) Transcript_31543:1297-1752(+)
MKPNTDYNFYEGGSKINANFNDGSLNNGNFFRNQRKYTHNTGGNTFRKIADEVRANEEENMNLLNNFELTVSTSKTNVMKEAYIGEGDKGNINERKINKDPRSMCNLKGKLKHSSLNSFQNLSVNNTNHIILPKLKPYQSKIKIIRDKTPK